MNNLKVLNAEKAFEKQCPFESASSDHSQISERDPFEADVDAEAASRNSACVRESKYKESFMGTPSRNNSDMIRLKQSANSSNPSLVL